MAHAYDVEVDGIYYDLNYQTKIAEVTFQNKNQPTYSGDVVIPEKITYKDEVFSVVSIRDYAFDFCSDLTSITIPNSITSVGNSAFSNCFNLTTVTIPNSVTKIGDYAFSGCSSLSSAILGNNVISMGESIFNSCTVLNEITIPSSVKSIGKYAFVNCPCLTTIVIPSSVINIGDDILGSCTGLISIKVESGNAIYDSRNNCNAIIESKSNTLIAGCQNTIIPNSVTKIGYGAFEYCKGLTSINIPNSVTNIGTNAFSGCTGLTSISLPNSLTIIGENAFSLCKNITSFVIPNSVTSINDYAFYGTGITSVYIGKSVSYIGYRAFLSCPFLVNVYCLSEIVPTTNTEAFWGSSPERMTLYVPTDSYDDYKATVPWSKFGTIKTLGEGSGTEPELDIKKCSTPTINYINNKLTFSCTTEAVEYVSEIKDIDIRKFFSDVVSLTATYEISVYATKEGYENSDVATATLVWTDAIFTVTTPETPTSAKEVKESIPVLISANGGVITVKSEQEGQAVAVYTADGKALGSANVKNGQATVATNIQRGEIVIVKVGGRSVKVKMSDF